ncbi:helix-turn-helix domain-containing protein [Catenovulum sp. 2E275]|uniref:helix-turn-helix domain-containing protein n=1 Tax=Catenovulum sp. 2E275 TaxID=2980497 RepID=UPI0021D35201|nr:helix-turn-helix domain-containing protein [Catenovulum sp. 2E275]MCU4675374.1 helix-turn-helix domain-containing protein [Catenovulum sp. 2E275]|eukprot:gnl/Carplike_NY0171/7961_a11034_137.p1 GENE.gnl/Carplike_NY0171/7961_a11034_137~~gnl/Carplike_NY0171/7961_a11034_137.p1  ORF type:complete len:189 (-),score=10.31 gnl/Carplike_NY0171/7961_a11034_137:72-638(-)
MKQNENVISLKKIFEENSLEGIGDDEGKLVFDKLVFFIDKKPEYKIFYISIKGVIFDASFAREALVRLAKRYRKQKGICLIDATSETLRLNILAPVLSLEQPMPFYDGDLFDHIKSDKIGVPSKTNLPIFKFVFDNGITSASEVAEHLDYKVNNASTKLKSLYEDGFLLRVEDKSETGGVEYKYYAIK